MHEDNYMEANGKQWLSKYFVFIALRLNSHPQRSELLTSRAKFSSEMLCTIEF